MSALNKTKINQLLQSWPQGTVALSSWLKEQNISQSLQARYVKSGWIESVGKGAYQRDGDQIDWQGGLYAIQEQAKQSIHVGGLTAVALQGSAHYVRFKENIQLFGSSDSKSPLPAWFKKHNWGDTIQLYRTNILPPNTALTEQQHKEFTITISSLERAILECLYLVPHRVDMVECYHIMEGLMTLRPNILQQLLNGCTSIKVKRMFFYMAEKLNPPWFKYLDTTNIDFGSGKRSIVQHGVYNKKYQITVPRELEDTWN